MRATTTSSLFGFGASALFLVVLAGCPPSFHEPCRGLECGLIEDDGGLEGDAATLPIIASVMVEGNASRKVRQGFGGEPAYGTTTVHLTGDRLDGATAVTLGDPPNELQGLIITNTATLLTFRVAIQHGMRIGSHAVKVKARSGSAMFADAISITAITAAPPGSNDLDIGLDTTGTDEHPLRALAKAITLAGPGDTISLKNGIYDAAHGETFYGSPGEPNVPAHLTVKGESREGTLLQGPGRDNCDVHGALNLSESVRVEALGIAGFCHRGIEVRGGTVTRDVVTIRDVAIQDTKSGVLVMADTILDSVDISGATLAVEALGTVRLTVTNGRMHHNRSGIDTQFADAPLIVTGTEIDHNCPGTMNRPDGGILFRASATLTDVRIHDNQCSGVNMPQGLNGPVDITGGVFSANTTAITLKGPGSVKVRGTSFGDERHAIHLSGGPSNFDLGTPESPGWNRFTLCDACDTIFDARPAPASGRNLITLRGNEWIRGTEQLTIPLGCSDMDYPKGQTAPPRIWHIEQPGSCPSSTGNVIVN